MSTSDHEPPPPTLRLATVCVDCADAHAMAAFYGRLLGWEVTAAEPDWVLMRDRVAGPACRSRRSRDTSRRCGPTSPTAEPR